MTPDDRHYLLTVIPAALATCVVIWACLVWAFTA